MYTTNWLDGSYTLKYVKTDFNDRDNLWSDGVGTLTLSGGTGTVNLAWHNQNVSNTFAYWLTDDDSAGILLGNRNYFVDFDIWNNSLTVELDQGRDEYSYIWTKDVTPPTPTPPTPTPTPPTPTPPVPTPPVNPALEQAYSQYFNATDYLLNKTAALNTNGLVFTETAVSQAFKAAGFTELQHFQTYGAFEDNLQGTPGINPSANVSLYNYYVAKQAQLKSTGLDFTVDAVVDAFAASGLDPIEHYVLYGQTEGLSLTGVATLAEAAPTA